MTVTSTVRKAGPFAGNNFATVFPFGFKVFAKGDVKVLRVNTNGLSVPLVLDSDYSVQLNVNQDSTPGGWITYPIAGAPLPTGYELVILGDLAYDQETDITNQGGFYPNVIEDMVDRTVIQIQQLDEIASRAIVIPESESAPTTLPIASARANTVIGFDAAGGMTTLPLPASVGAGDLKNEEWTDGTDFTAGTSTSVVLSRVYGTKANLGAVMMQGVGQAPSTYSLNNTTLQFNAVIPLGVSKIWCVGGTTLSTELPPAGSVGDTQLVWAATLFRSVDSVDAVRQLDGARYARAFAVGYRGVGTAGGGAFYADPSDAASADNGVTVIVANDGMRWKRPATDRALLTMAGAYGDGVTDDSAAIQACVDAMKGKTVIADKDMTFYVAGVTLSGATYNGTTIVGDGLFKLKPDGGLNTFGGGWVGLLIQQCDGVNVKARFDGNRANMTAREQIICVGVAGASNLVIDAETNEIRGDGVYIGQANWLANSGHTTNVRIRVKGTNTADDGRNLLSVIDCSGLTVDDFNSQRIGGTINGVVMPGGLDIEPDFGYQSVSGVTIKNLDVVTAGTSGFGIVGKSVSGVDANLDWNCTDIRVEKWKVLKIGTAGSAISGSPFTRVADFHFGEGSYQYNTTPGAGPVFDFCQRVSGKLIVTNVTYGMWLAPAGTFFDPTLEITATNFTLAGVRTTDVQGGRIFGSAKHAVGGSTAFGVQCYSNARVIVQGNVTYEVDAPYDNVMARAFRNEPGLTVGFGAGTIAQNCDWSGYASYDVTNDALIPLKNVRGMTAAAAIPGNGTWHWSTFVDNTQKVSTGGKTTLGWARLNSGSNNVAGNDWAACVCTNA